MTKIFPEEYDEYNGPEYEDEVEDFEDDEWSEFDDEKSFIPIPKKKPMSDEDHIGKHKKKKDKSCRVARNKARQMKEFRVNREELEDDYGE